MQRLRSHRTGLMCLNLIHRFNSYIGPSCMYFEQTRKHQYILILFFFFQKKPLNIMRKYIWGRIKRLYIVFGFFFFFKFWAHYVAHRTLTGQGSRLRPLQPKGGASTRGPPGKFQHAGVITHCFSHPSCPTMASYFCVILINKSIWKNYYHITHFPVLSRYSLKIAQFNF